MVLITAIPEDKEALNYMYFFNMLSLFSFAYFGVNALVEKTGLNHQVNYRKPYSIIRIMIIVISFALIMIWMPQTLSNKAVFAQTYLDKFGINYLDYAIMILSYPLLLLIDNVAAKKLKK